MQEPINSHQPQEFRPCRKFFFPLAFVAIALIFATSVFVFDIRMPGARLQDAAEKGNVEEVRRLLAKGVDVNWQNTYGTALHRAATMGHLPVARLLLESGADVNARRKEDAGSVFFKAYREAIFIPENIEQAFGVTPLHLAVHKNRKEMVEFLISKGADVDAMFTLGRDWSPKFARTTIQIAGSQTNTEMVILLQKASEARRKRGQQ